jgi:HSP20 family protein
MAEKRTDVPTTRQEARLTHKEPTGWEPFGMIQRFTDEMDRVFDEFGFGRNWLMPRFGHGYLKSPWRFGETEYLWAPNIDIFQRKDELVLRADLPGLTKEDIKVEVGEDALTIQGERKRSEEEKREGFYRAERSYGSFYRVIPLPKGAIADHAKASFKDGVLEVCIPAPPEHETRGRRLEIGEGKK